MLRALHAFMNACFTSSCLRGDHDEDAIPPAQLTAASEATSADTAARALPEDVGRRQAHNLLDLPDDILRLILLELHDGLLGVAEKECSRKAIPSHYLDVNKRLRSLAQPIWGRILRNPPASDPAKVFLRLLSFTNRSYTSPSSRNCAISNGWSWTWRCLGRWTLGAAAHVLMAADTAVALSRALRRLRRLASLTLYDPTSSDDPHFSLERDAPWLRTLRAISGPWLQGVVSRGVANLDELVYLSEKLEWFIIPHTVRRIGISGSISAIESGQFLIDFKHAFAFTDVNPASVALRTVDLGFFALSRDTSSLFNTPDLLAVIDVLNPLPLRELVVKASFTIAWPEKLKGKLLPSLESLSLLGPVRVYANLSSLSNLLGMLHNLKELVLVGATFADAPTDVDILAKLSPGERAIRFPHPAALLAYLRHSTQVMRFTYMREKMGSKMRWTRSSIEEEFVGDLSQASEDASFDEKEKLDEDEPGEDELSVVSDDLRQPRGLLDLPDELLSPIFYQVYEILRTSQATDGTREPIPTHCLALNKRLAALVRPIWCRDLFSPPSASIGSYLNTVLSVPGVRDLLRTVDIVITSPEPTLYLTLLAHYAGIASLTLDIDPAASKDSPHTVSKAITRLLRQLPRLSYLDLRRCADTDDPDLDLAVDVPALSSLAVNTGAWCDGNVQRGCENIRFLELRTSTLAGICIPPSPQHLRFRPMLGRSCDDNLSVVPLKGFLKEVPVRDPLSDSLCASVLTHDIVFAADPSFVA
ncbi:hypothetical protein NBRC10513_003406 [Rhodotorula toruloides]